MSGSACDVSVVIPTRNRAQMLAAAMQSVFLQRGVDLELIVVDEASTDDTQALLASVNDDRLRVLRHDTPKGVSAARNAGIAVARGRWIGMLDDDDLWRPDKLAGQVAAAEQAGAEWVYSSVMQFLPDLSIWMWSGAPDPGVVQRRLPHDNVVPGGASSALARREAVIAAGGFDTGMHMLADWDMWLKLSAGGIPAAVSDYAVAYRIHPTNMSLKRMDLVLTEAAVIDSRYTDLRGGPLDLVPFYRWMAVVSWRAGDYRNSRRRNINAWRLGDRRAALRLARSLVPINRLRPNPGPPPGVDDSYSKWLAQAVTSAP